MAAPQVSNALLLAQYECSICNNYAFPPYFQCQRGHFYCNTCLARVAVCPGCRGPKPIFRNLVMEHLGEQLFFPCAWADRGCLEMLAFNEREAHEDICPLKLFTCPHRHQYACTWQGADVLGHMIAHPSTTLVVKDNDVWKFHVSGGVLRQNAPATFLLQSADILLIVTTHCFVSAVTRGEKRISHYAIVAQLIGSQQVANDYAVQILASGNRSVLVYSGMLKNDVVNRSEMLEKGHCLTLQHALATEMIAGPGTMEVEIKLIPIPE